MAVNRHLPDCLRVRYQFGTGSSAAQWGVRAPLAGQAGFGFTRDAIWLKLDLHENAGALKPDDGHWWLEVALSSLDDLCLYVPEADGRYRMTRLGDHQPFAERPLTHRLFLFSLELPGTYSLYLRVAAEPEKASQPPRCRAHWVSMVLWQLPQSLYQANHGTTIY